MVLSNVLSRRLKKGIPTGQDRSSPSIPAKRPPCTIRRRERGERTSDLLEIEHDCAFLFLRYRTAFRHPERRSIPTRYERRLSRYHWPLDGFFLSTL
uniref:Uncharacterized protein n=1 Tax=Utricularia reniformis TaxID=192314 RepID=A0A1Y0AZZ5_9LAMI|nr:hypothetical protein AEK19_MT0460 [Utricularia reniformis]ART30720.1 hypothetical protein AEK19_MT0460 [Utricularia reniformis]